MSTADHARLAARQAAVARALAWSSQDAADEALAGDAGPALDAAQVAWSRTQLRIKRSGSIAHRAPLLAEFLSARRDVIAEYLDWVESGGGAAGESTLAETAEFSAHVCGRMAVPSAVVDELLVLRDLAAGSARVRMVRDHGRWMIRVGRRRRFGGRGRSNAGGA